MTTLRHFADFTIVIFTSLGLRNGKKFYGSCADVGKGLDPVIRRTCDRRQQSGQTCRWREISNVRFDPDCRH